MIKNEKVGLSFDEDGLDLISSAKSHKTKETGGPSGIGGPNP